MDDKLRRRPVHAAPPSAVHTATSRAAAARGFTLIEVVVALAIVAIGMLAAFRAVTTTASNAAYLRDRTFAAWIAADLITDLRLRGQMPSIDETRGALEYANRQWRWRTVVVQTQVANLRQVRVSVRLSEDPDDAWLVEMVGVLGAAQLASVPSPTPWAGADSATGTHAMNRRILRGFTLLELLVAISIFTIVAVMAYRGYAEAAGLAERARSQTRRLAELQQAVRTMVIDFASIAPRPVREPIGDGYRPALLRDPNSVALVELSRGGWSNTAGLPRGTVQRIRYRLDGTTLLREHWVVTDATLAVEPVGRRLLTGVRTVELRYMNASREWQNEWPLSGGIGTRELRTRPLAVEFVIELEDYGRLRRIVEVPG